MLSESMTGYTYPCYIQ